MKKYITNFASGFTIAELLISILVSSILFAAMVPVIGLKKIKHPLIHTYHGIAECYWGSDDSDAVTFYSETSRRNPITTGAANGDHCTFNVPKNAQFLQIYVIGAGGNSFSDDVTATPAEVPQDASGSISPTDKFNADINAASTAEQPYLSQSIRDLIARWSKEKYDGQGIPVRYKLRSPLGIGGAGMCRAVRIHHYGEDPEHRELHCEINCANGFNNKACIGPMKGSGIDAINGSWYLTEAAEAYANNAGSAGSMSNWCWAYVHGKGSTSGYARSTEWFELPVNQDSKINITQNYDMTELRVSNNDSENYVRLTSSGNGYAPLYNEELRLFYLNPGIRGTDAECSGIAEVCANSFLNDNTDVGVHITPGSAGGKEVNFVGGIDCQTNYTGASSVASLGRVDADPIRYESYYLPVSVTYPPAGAHGDMQVMIFEKLGGTLNLYPAKDISKKSYVSRKGTSEILINADSAQNNAEEPVTETYYISALEGNILEKMKQAAKPNNEIYFSEYLSKLESSRFHGGLYGCLNQNTCPGFGASGSYLALDLTGVTGNLIDWWNGKPYGAHNTPKNIFTLRIYRNSDEDKLATNSSLAYYAPWAGNPVGTDSPCDFGDSVSGSPISIGWGITGFVCTKSHAEGDTDYLRGNPGAVIILW